MHLNPFSNLHYFVVCVVLLPPPHSALLAPLLHDCDNYSSRRTDRTHRQNAPAGQLRTYAPAERTGKCQIPAQKGQHTGIAACQSDAYMYEYCIVKKYYFD